MEFICAEFSRFRNRKKSGTIWRFSCIINRPLAPKPSEPLFKGAFTFMILRYRGNAWLSVLSLSLLLLLTGNAAEMPSGWTVGQSARGKAGNSARRGKREPAVQTGQKSAAQKNNASAKSGLRSEEVKITGASVQLAGTLTLPKLEAGKRAPAVVIYSDTAPATRDGLPAARGMHALYRDVAENPTSRGFVVLRYDRRCAGMSECKPHSAFREYLDDGLAAYRFLRNRQDVDPARLFIFGHGDGGLLAGMVVTHAEMEKEKPAGLILTSATGRTPIKNVRDYIRVVMTGQGKSETEITGKLKNAETLFQRISNGDGRHDDLGLDPKNEVDALLIRLAGEAGSSFEYLYNDPLQVYRLMTIPVLIVHGEKDIFIGAKDAEFIDEALLREEHKDVTLKLLPDSDYVFKTTKGTASFQTWRDSARNADPAFLTTVNEWLMKRVK
jgi:alpha-beta hydrolase superfamily lysophospholipase